MKRSFFICLILIAFSGLLQAQVVNVCGTDTIILEVDNYDKGLIEWQESPDTVNWTRIEDASGTSYTFFPTETKYYRAVVTTTDCDPLYSEISFVQIAPLANAGTDRTIGGTSTNLMANSATGAEGEWHCISGNGTIEEVNNQNTLFTGEYDQTYTLIWTLTNSCGQSSDTVSISFEEILAKTNFIVVDNTDSLYSDSLEIASGTLRITFSDASINPVDSTILIGMRDDTSFLLRIKSYTFNNNIFTIKTEQATLADLFEKGTINIGDAVNQSVSNENTKSANVFPTRKTLEKYKNNEGIKVLYAQDFSPNSKLPLKSANEDKKEFTLPLGSRTLSYENKDSGVKVALGIKDAEIKITPNVVFDMKYEFPAKLNDLTFGLDNAVIEYNYNDEFYISGSIDLLEKPIKESYPIYKKHMVFAAGPVPVVVTASFDVIAKLEVKAEAEVKLTDKVLHEKTITALVTGKNKNNLSLVQNSTETTTHDQDLDVTASVSSEFKVGPRISCKLYDIVGPYFGINLKMGADLCASNEGNYNLDMSVGVDGIIGANAAILGKDLFSFKKPLFDVDFGYFKTPYRIDLISGNYQHGTPETMLAAPLVFRVTKSNGGNARLIPVRIKLDDGQGKVTNEVVYTDIDGKARFNWTLGTEEFGVLKARVLNCNNKDITNSPVYVYAYTTDNYNCANSNLSISLENENGYLIPVAKGGASPYLYSEDGTSFSETLPSFDSGLEGTYTIHVQDANKCVTSRSITITPKNPCSNSNLLIDALLIQADILNVSAKGGEKPYLFTVDNGAFSEKTTFSYLPVGEHRITVQDALGCENSRSISITKEVEKPALALLKPAEGSFVNPENVEFKWSSGYLMANDFDIYLKEDGGTESLIKSSFLNTDYAPVLVGGIHTYTYNENLGYGKHYTGRIVAKYETVEYATTEFSFYTKRGMSVEMPVPTLLTPANNANVAENTTTLTWRNEGKYYNYDVYLGAGSIDSLKMVANQYDGTELPLTELLDITYYWKVKINSLETGHSKESEVWSFNLGEIAPTVITLAASEETSNSVVLQGDVTSDGNAAITERGFYWSQTNTSPDETDNKEIVSGTIGDFNKKLTGLAANTTYYVRAYATNSKGTAYSDEVSFKTTTANDIVYGSFTDPRDGYTYKTIKIGEQTWMAENLNFSVKKVDQNDNGVSEYNDISVWENGQYCKLYSWEAANIACPEGWHLPSDTEWQVLVDYLGGKYVAGGKMKSTMGWESPNTDATNSSGFSALPGGFGLSSGPLRWQGFSGWWWSSTPNTSIGACYRSLDYKYAGVSRNNSSGIERGWGLSVRCIKDTGTQTVTTASITNITQTTATAGSNVNTDGGIAVTARGICWNTTGNPTTTDSKTTDGSGIGDFTSNLTSLIANTTYYVRAYATNSKGTAYSEQVSFKTTTVNEIVYGSFTDSRDGHTYKTVIINGKEWMAENLAYLPQVNPPSGESYTEPYYYVYGYNGTSVSEAKATDNYTTYGVLYNWPAAKAACPTGWHLPTDAEWTELTDYLITNGFRFGGSGADIAKAMAAKTTWNSHSSAGTPGNDLDSNNSSGFSALPGGCRSTIGYFRYIGSYGYWWSSTEYNNYGAWGRFMTYFSPNITWNPYDEDSGFSVRCVRD